MTLSFASQALIDAGRWIDQRGWCPATGGNFSMRLGDDRALVTTSGRHKGYLTDEDFLQVNLAGEAITPGKPSAETLVHTALYRLSPQIGAVLHTHSVASTVLSRLTPGDHLPLEGFEMQKSLQGNLTHEATVCLPIFDNTQDMQVLAEQIEQRWRVRPLQWGLLVRSHGLYAWGQTIDEARRHLEGLEFLFACEMEMRRLGGRG